jgi:DNA-binding MarR family transcriptional regulator
VNLATRDYEVLARFRYGLRVFQRFSEDAARAAGVTPAQHQLLLAVRGFPGGRPTISELAEWLQLRHNSTVELIDRAEEAGLLTRHTDGDDRRRQRLELTPSGSELLGRLSAAHRQELRRFREEFVALLDELG